MFIQVLHFALSLKVDMCVLVTIHNQISRINAVVQVIIVFSLFHFR